VELDSLYQEVILDHYRSPHHKGLSEPKDIQVHHNNPSCGDEVTLNLVLKNQVVQDISWDGVGCSISMASVSVMSDLLIGKKYDDALKILESFVELMHGKGKSAGNEELLEDGVAFAGVSKFPARIKCALLGWMAFKDAVSQLVR
jgi:nitrogen fixation NifU-like protein